MALFDFEFSLHSLLDRSFDGTNHHETKFVWDEKYVMKKLRPRKIDKNVRQVKMGQITK